MKSRVPILLLLLITPILLGLCLLFGTFGVGFPQWGTPTGDAIFHLRLQRVLTGFLVGASLSCAGAVFQALLRNPLAEPYVLGVSSGGALGAAIAMLSGLSALSAFTVPACAFVSAALTLLLVYLLASQDGQPSVYSLILSGVIVSAVASSLLMFLISRAPNDAGLHSVIWWMLGSLQAESAVLLSVCAVPMAVGFAGLWLLAPELNALTLGREMAHSLGVRTVLAMVLGLVLATVMTAAAVGLAGLIGFVGLVVPHAARAVFGPDHRRLLPATALAGGVFLAVCDALARTALGSVGEIPVGVVTAFVGGPFFLFILRQRRKGGWLA